MKPTDTQQTKATDLPILSSQSQGWTPILVEQFQSPLGEARCHYSDQHSI